MSEKPFSPINTEQPKQLKNFQIPLPGTQTKPTVIIGQQAYKAYKKIFVSLPKEGKREDKQFIITDTEIVDQEVGRSKIFNQPIYSDIMFHGGSYQDENNKTVNYEPLQIDLVLLTVRNPKNIIKTTLQGREGTVKEYISGGDYDIVIEGKIYGNGINNYPISDVQKLIQLGNVPASIKVTSSYLKMFNVEDIVIEEPRIKQEEGMRNCQPFTLYCCSDKPLILLKNA